MFLETPRFPDEIARGLTVRRRRSTRKMPGENGYETRVKLWTESRREFECRLWIWDDDRLAQIVEFFEIADGDWSGFRARDWSDFTVGYRYLGGGMYEATAGMSLGTGDGARKVWDLTKTYGLALGATGGALRTRRVFKPRSGESNAPLVALVNGATVAATWDTVNGRVTLATAPTAGQTVAWRGVYDVPMRLDGDVLEIDLKALSVGQTSVLKLVEIKMAV